MRLGHFPTNPWLMPRDANDELEVKKLRYGQPRAARFERDRDDVC
jgi:hypothetical protein